MIAEAQLNQGARKIVATVYRQTGLREIGEWYQLQASGAVVLDVPAAPRVEVRLDGATTGRGLLLPAEVVTRMGVC